MRGLTWTAFLAVCSGLVACSSGEGLEESGFATMPISASGTTPPPSTMTMADVTSMPTGTTADDPTASGTGSMDTTAGDTDDDDTGVTTTADPTAATAVTMMPSFCGDGKVGADEECDDENQVETDSCLNTCVMASCGDLLINAGVEDCDDGNMIETDSCLNNCAAATCGDGVVQAGVEGCDDGNAIENDGCTSSCQVGSCGDSITQMGEECDDGNAINTDGCLATCKTAKCGDGAVYGGVEACDGGGESAQCNGDCTPAACGDGKTNGSAGEQCDTGGQSASCDGNCTTAQCGDGQLNPQAGEACDDGNGNNGDGCSSGCQVEVISVCTTGNDPGTGAPWVVCGADQNSVWISHNNPGGGGIYHPIAICQSLGYPNLQAYGGTCQGVCGFCDGNGCGAPGSMTFAGGGECGSDGFGPALCFTVMWRCTK